jgi:hypothetical protein
MDVILILLAIVAILAALDAAAIAFGAESRDGFAGDRLRTRLG